MVIGYMALFNKINTAAKTASNTGFGENSANYGGRFVQKDGQANIQKTGIGFLEKYSWFHTMLAIPGIQFFFIILGFYIIINIFFALLYYFIGVEHLSGMNTTTEWDKLMEAFFFSAQTFTTVGYGRISPTGVITSAIAAFQALIGLLSFAVATGLMYGRFSKPTAYLKFSHNAIIAPYKDITALMVRVAPYKNTTLTDAEARLTLGMMIEENGEKKNRFYPMDLEIEKISALTLSWTIVHPITKTSPLYQFREADLLNSRTEVLIFLKAFDDMFSNTVVARSSYVATEIIYGAKFKPMFRRNTGSNATILDLGKLNDFESVVLG